MKPWERMENLRPYGLGGSHQMRMTARRAGVLDLPHYQPDTVDGANEIAKRLMVQGGFPQQERMIRDKRRSLDKATLYSYQAALVRKYIPEDIEVMEGERNKPPARALINPDKNKQDYDDKIISIGFEHNFHPGDVFEWCRTHSYWLIVLQDLDEIAYFRGSIRRCDYKINWLNDKGEEKSTFAAVRGPVETKIDYIQKHGISVDNPNHSLHILMPKNPDTMKQFKRYAKFYLKTADDPDDDVCWRVEATDSISTKGILEINAVEYYANEIEDDVEKGLVGAFVTKLEDPNKDIENNKDIIGDVFIKPKREYNYYVKTQSQGRWYLENKPLPVSLVSYTDEKNRPAVRIKWNVTYHGQFDLFYQDNDGIYQKTIVVESLF